MAQESRIATYKNRKYKLLWIGQTRFGERAHLAFLNGSKDFWADAAKVTVVEESTVSGERPASREEQHGRYLDAGPLNWDDRD